MERHAAIMLNKILADDEPNYLDLRIPGGACIGQIGYAPDGSIYSADEGRFVAAWATTCSASAPSTTATTTS